MTQNPPLHPPQSLPSSSSSAAAKGCFNCNSDDPFILHHIRIPVGCRKFCTSCVLKLHPTSFCPTCFNLHDPNSLNPPPLSSSSSSSFSNNRTLTCLRCKSVSHITCVSPNAPKSPYLCPPCLNPSFKFFDYKKPKRFRDQPQSDGDGGGGSHSKKVQEEQQVLDERAAKVLLLAAKISVISMNKAASQAKAEMDRRAKEAALAKKRAKEAILHVDSLYSKLINVKQRRDVIMVSGPDVVLNVVPKVENNGGAHNVALSSVPRGDIKVGNGNGSVAVVPMGQSNGGNNENTHVGKERTAV